ncbi:MAG: hypothetical protein HPY69_13295 [Armatimonadetes bacterium]|nr:hypothetical protein [Armatimonadota bacterium]
MTKYRAAAMTIAVAAALLGLWLTWQGYLLVLRSRIASFVGVPTAYVQPQHNGLLGMHTPGPYFNVTAPDGHHLATAFATLSGTVSGITFAVRPGGLIEPREPDPLLTAEGTDRLARELIERFWDNAPVSLQRVNYQKDKPGGVKASWRTSGPEVRVYTLIGMPGRFVAIERGEPQP